MRQYRTFWFLLTMMLVMALTACTNGDDNPVDSSSDLNKMVRPRK